MAGRVMKPVMKANRASASFETMRAREKKQLMRRGPHLRGANFIQATCVLYIAQARAEG